MEPGHPSRPCNSPDELTLDRIEAAARRIAGHVRRTPMLTSADLDERAKAEVVLKPEMLQRTGSFKFRGALNRLACTTPAERSAGVVTYSSGNHGAAVALAGRIVGTHVTVVAPVDAPRIKLEAIRSFGAQLRLYEPGSQRREDVAAAIARDQGALVVPPFDDVEVMAGQGTVALELVDDHPDLGAVVVPVGGGGLLAGIATAVRALVGPGCRIVGVEPTGADDTRRSLAAGRRVELGEVSTSADGLRAPTPGVLTFEVNRRLVDRVVVVSEPQIADAMRYCFEELKLVVEPSGAVGLAAVLAGAAGDLGPRVGVVLSGGNVDARRFAELYETVRPAI